MPTHNKPGRGHHTSRCKHWSGPSLRPQGSMFPFHSPLEKITHPTRRHASDHKPRRGHYTSRCKHWSGLSQGRKNNRRKHWNCAKLTKTAGHQMAGIIQNLRRKPLILRGKSHRSIGDFMGVNSPILRPILEGPPAHNPYCSRTDLGDTPVGRLGDDAASRSDPTFTRASQGLRQ